MPGKNRAVYSGLDLQNKVIELAKALGLNAEREVTAARRLWGTKRRIDVVLRDERTGKILGIECKYQVGPGTAEEKIPALIKDMEFWPIPGLVVIEGEGFSENMKGYLIATGKVVLFEDLEDWLRLYFVLDK